MKYGTKYTVPLCQFGVSDCSKQESLCCTYNPRDGFTDFSVENRTNLLANCEGRTTCSGWAPRLFNSPYSSYIWIKYACAEDKKNMIDMCSAARVEGREVFLSYGKSTTGSAPVVGDSTQCSCRIVPTCNTYLGITFVDLDFNRPGTSPTNCSSSSLADSALGKTFRCLSADNVHTMTRFSVYGKHDTVTLRQRSSNDGNDRPNYILIHYTSTSPVSVECFPAGSDIQQSPSLCSSTAQTSTPTPVSSSPSRTSLPHVKTTATSTESKPVTATTLKSTISLQTNFTKPSSSQKVNASSRSTEHVLKSLSTQLMSSGISVSSVLMSSQTPASSKETLSSSAVASSTTSTAPTTSSSSTGTTTPSISTASYRSTTSYQTQTEGRGVHSINASVNSTLLPTFSSSLSLNVSVSQSKSHHFTTELTTRLLPSSLNTTKTKTTKRFPHITASSEQSSTTAFYSVAPSMSTANEYSNMGEQTSINDLVTTTNTKIYSEGHSTTASVNLTVDTNDDGGAGKGLIIGVTVGAILLIAIITMAVVMCFCIRLKRKEKVRRNYIHNTNIFYSFPEDHNNDTSTEHGEVYTFNQNYESSEQGNGSYIINPFQFEDYKIKSSHASNLSNGSVGVSSAARQPSTHADYASILENETVDVTNDNVPDMNTPTSNGNGTGVKTVTFKDSTEYEKALEEGKTKF